jgi:hypothetical protein
VPREPTVRRLVDIEISVFVVRVQCLGINLGISVVHIGCEVFVFPKIDILCLSL